jgi:hypothetical protein
MRAHDSTSSWFPPTLSVSRGASLELQVSDQQRIDDIERFIGLSHKDCPSAGEQKEKLAVWHRNLAPVGKMQDKRLERLDLRSGLNLFNVHGWPRK